MDTNETWNKYFLPAAVIIAGLLIAGAVVWNNSRPAGTAGPTAPSVNIKDIKTEGDPFIGAANAPITIAFWGDFQCPFCKKFEIDTLPLLVKDYVDTGKVKIIFMDFAFLGSDSIDAGVYSRAIWNLYPDKYFAWRTAMYIAQDAENGGFGNATSIDKLNATIAGIDAVKVEADVKENRSAYESAMNADKAETQKAGVNATPSFVIGTQVIQGAYPYPTFQAAIDALLK